MWSDKLTREEFMELIGRPNGADPLRLVRGQDTPPDRPPYLDEIWAVWPDRITCEGELPYLLVVAEDRSEDFLAWSATFLQSVRPFTSYFRVLPWDQFERLRRLSVDEKLSSRSDVLVGLILGEALTQSKSRATVATMPVNGIASLLSYVMVRAWITGWDDLLVIASAWQKTQLLADRHHRALDMQESMLVWQTVMKLRDGGHFSFGLSGSESAILEACSELWSEREVSRSTLDRLMAGRFEPHFLRRGMTESRERRVRLFNEMVRVISESERSLHADAFLCGYAASLISEGTLDHADLLFPFLDRFPTAVMWYGYCAGCSPQTRLKEVYGGLGYRILRDVTRHESLMSRPTADLSLAEFNILSRGVSGMEEVRSSGGSSLVVELVPGVNGVFRWPRKHPVPSQMSLPVQPDPMETMQGLKRINTLIEEAAALSQDMISKSAGRSTSSDSRRRFRTK